MEVAEDVAPECFFLLCLTACKLVGLGHALKGRVQKTAARTGRINVSSFSLPKRLLILYTCSCNLADRFIGQQESQLTTVLLQPVGLNNPAKERFIDRSPKKQEDFFFQDKNISQDN